jgi:hypothetical protein
MTQLFAGHESELIAGGIGAVGVLAGAFVSVLWTEFFNQRSRKRDRKERFATGTFAVYQKLNYIYSLTMVRRDHLSRGILEAILIGAPFLYSTTLPVFGHSKLVEFTTDDLWAITQVGGADLVNTVNSLDNAFNQQSAIMRYYSEERRGLTSRYPPSTRIVDGVASIGVTQEQFFQMQPIIVELDGIVLQTHTLMTQLLTDTFQALRALVYAREKPLGPEFGITLPGLDGKDVAISALEAPREWDWFLGVPYRTGHRPAGPMS